MAQAWEESMARAREALRVDREGSFSSSFGVQGRKFESLGFADESATSKDDAPLSVSDAMARAKGALEGVTVRLVGEVSEVNAKAGYKAVYFTVKDAGAALPCMMWNNRYRSCGVELSVGALVELSGRFTLYAAKGRMNFDVFSVTLAGEGNLRAQVANLARKLQGEGLMDASRKRALPHLPETIGLVTSPRGAAIHDVLRTLRRRWPLARVIVAGVPVEGASAPAALTEGLRCVCDAGAEVALLVRGGGSFEDLMPFNDEGLARTVASLPIPVVTGIGHEPDTSIADLVSDVRASTPTAAAEAVSPAPGEMERLLCEGARSMRDTLMRRIDLSNATLSRIADRPLFKDPSLLFSSDAQTLDYLSERLSRALPAGIERDASRVSALSDRLRAGAPRITSAREAGVQSAATRLAGLGRTLTSRFGSEVGLRASRLHDLSPLVVLSRGYAIVKTKEGEVLKRVGQTEPGANVSVEVSDGVLRCRVEEINRIDTAVEPWEEL